MLEELYSLSSMNDGRWKVAGFRVLLGLCVCCSTFGRSSTGSGARGPFISQSFDRNIGSRGQFEIVSNCGLN